MARRSPEDWWNIRVQAEAQGWSQKKVAGRLKVSAGTVAAGFKRGLEWHEGQQRLQERPALASGARKQTPTATAESMARHFDGLTPEQAGVVLARLQGATVTEAAEAAGCSRSAASRWLNQDPVVMAAYSAMQADLHVATVHRIQHGAQAGVDAMVQAIQKMLDILNEEMPVKLPRGADPDEYEGDVITMPGGHVGAAKAIAVLAGRLMDSGGYPKAERLEVSGKVEATLEDVGDLVDEVQAAAAVAPHLRVIDGG